VKKRVILAMMLLCAVIFVPLFGCTSQPTGSTPTAGGIVAPNEPQATFYTADDFLDWFMERQDYSMLNVETANTIWNNGKDGERLYHLAFDEGDSEGFVLLFSDTEYAYGRYTKGQHIINIAFVSPDEAAEMPNQSFPHSKPIGNFGMALHYNKDTERMERIIFELSIPETAIFPQNDDGSDMMLVWAGD
jgi:hypothetical protein